ncbi:MAG: alpha-galactosidase [Dehalococcoidia bacterium]
MPSLQFEETDRGLSLTNGSLTVEVHLNKGTYDIHSATPGVPAITNAAATVILRDGPTFSTRGEDLEFVGTTDVSDTHGKGVTLLLTREAAETEPEVHILITLYERQPFVIVHAEIQNPAASPLRMQEFRPLDGATLETEAKALRFYKHGWQSWSPTVVLDTTGVDVVTAPPVIGPGTQPESREGRFTSDLVTAIVDPSTNHGAVVGFTSNTDQFSHVWFDRNTSSLSAASYADGIELRPRGVLSSEPLYIELTSYAVHSLATFGDTLAAEMDARPPTEVTSGWCSWYYYWQGVSEPEVVANLDYLAANRDALPVEYVQIDDGYQAEIGDWLTVNDKFPHGMKWLADDIHARGLKAGVWVAPFLAGARSRLFQEHPAWFVKFTTGEPAIATLNWGQLCYALDLTHPEVAEWLEATFRTICDEWGYDYVKIDFIFAGAVDGVRHDPNVTRAQAYRRGVEIIRDAVGDRFILACGNPQGPSVGLVDGARVGPDVAPYWLAFDRPGQRTPLSDPSALNSIRNSINRFWMNGRLWMNDPDCLLVRESDTALKLDEVRSLATVIGMTGGMVLSSDKLPKLSLERQNLISLLLPVYGKTAVPLDLFQAPDVPQVLELNCGTHRMLALFNWSDEEAMIEEPLPGSDWHAFELWNEEYLGVVSSLISLRIPPHGCKLLRLTPVLGHPQVMGSTLHLLQGAMEIAGEDWDGKSLRISLTPVAKQDGALYIWGDGNVKRIPIEGLREKRTLTI